MDVNVLFFIPDCILNIFFLKSIGHRELEILWDIHLRGKRLGGSSCILSTLPAMAILVSDQRPTESAAQEVLLRILHFSQALQVILMYNRFCEPLFLNMFSIWCSINSNGFHYYSYMPITHKFISLNKTIS